MLITDIHLARFEPTLHVAVADVATELESQADATISGFEVESALADFDVHQVTSDHVLVIGDVTPHEIIERISENVLSVSRLRADDGGPLVPPVPGTNKKARVRTFARQIAQAQAWLLGAIGLEAEDPESEQAIVNVTDVQRLLALRVIADVFAAEAASKATVDSLTLRAALYADRARLAIESTSIQLDLDGDGEAEETRSLRSATLHRK